MKYRLADTGLASKGDSAVNDEILFGHSQDKPRRDI